LPTYGILSTGFNIKPLSAILADIQAVELSEISTALNIQADSIIGVLNGIVAQAAFDEWQALNALYNGMDPDQATDDQLTSLALITGTAREASIVSGIDILDLTKQAKSLPEQHFPTH